MERKKYPISSRLLAALKQTHATPGASKQNLSAIVRYRHAAKLIWHDYPTLSKDDMAFVLTDLHAFVPGGNLRAMAKTTIRKYLKGKEIRAGKVGRPPKNTADVGPIELGPYAKKI